MEDIILQNKQVSNSKWKILVLDKLSVRIMSACCKMKDVIDEGITLVEDLSKNRQPMPTFEVIYFITPTKDSITRVIEDFNKDRKYKYVHIYLTDSCPDHLFKMIGQNSVTKYIKTLKEVNIAFLPYESQVFSLDCQDSFEAIYSPQHINKREKVLERIAEQLSTVCATLGEYPAIRYRQDGENSTILAQILQNKLNAFKADNPTMGEGPDKARSQMIIVDRGFDPVSVLLHELTYQAMVQDLLQIENDVYKYEQPQSGMPPKQVLLDEDDDLWITLRHEHIAVVTQKVTTHLKNFAREKRMGGSEKTTMRDLSNMLKKMPQYQKELSKYSTHLHMAEDCMKHYQERVDKLCKVEQDLAMGNDTEGNPIKDPMKNVVHILLDQDIHASDKIRIILLYIVLKGGIQESALEKLIQHARISPGDEASIRNLALLGVNVLQKDGQKKKWAGHKLSRLDYDVTYQLSRWTPVLKDVMLMACEDKLDHKVFPFLSGRGNTATKTGARSARYQWHEKKGPQEYKSGPRLFVFVIGGMTCSEMRCAYEVTNSMRGKPGKNWEVLLGSTHMLHPNNFLIDLMNLTNDQQNNQPLGGTSEQQNSGKINTSETAKYGTMAFGELRSSTENTAFKKAYSSLRRSFKKKKAQQKSQLGSRPTLRNPTGTLNKNQANENLKGIENEGFSGDGR